MALFSRRKRTEPADGPGDEGLTDAEQTSGAAEDPRGPFDEKDAPEADRIDLGGLRVPLLDGAELRLEVDQRSGAVTSARISHDGSALQLQAFAAPRSRGLWDEVRGALRDSVVSQGGTAETREGPFGTELLIRQPVKEADGRTSYHRARFIGVDGPRWFLRGILTGRAAVDAERAARFETILGTTVVVRGGEAMAPQELIPLSVPGQRPGLTPVQNPIDPLGRGPEIAEIR